MRLELTLSLTIFLFLSACMAPNESSEDAQLSNEEKPNQKLPLNKSELQKLADELYQRNDYGTAIIVLDKLIFLDSTMGEAFYKRGYAKSQLFDKEGAKSDYLKSAELNFRTADAYFNIAMIFLGQFNDSAALIYLKKAKSLDPNNELINSELKALEERISHIK